MHERAAVFPADRFGDTAKQAWDSKPADAAARTGHAVDTSDGIGGTQPSRARKGRLNGVARKLRALIGKLRGTFKVGDGRTATRAGKRAAPAAFVLASASSELAPVSTRHQTPWAGPVHDYGKPLAMKGDVIDGASSPFLQPLKSVTEKRAGAGDGVDGAEPGATLDAELTAVLEDVDAALDAALEVAPQAVPEAAPQTAPEAGPEVAPIEGNGWYTPGVSSTIWKFAKSRKEAPAQAPRADLKNDGDRLYVNIA